jgi:hypothetical protein
VLGAIFLAMYIDMPNNGILFPKTKKAQNSHYFECQNNHIISHPIAVAKFFYLAGRNFGRFFLSKTSGHTDARLAQTLYVRFISALHKTLRTHFQSSKKSAIFVQLK